METVKLTSGTSGEQASDARLRMMSTDEICALVAFMLDPGRDEVGLLVDSTVATRLRVSHAHFRRLTDNAGNVLRFFESEQTFAQHCNKATRFTRPFRHKQCV